MFGYGMGKTSKLQAFLKSTSTWSVCKTPFSSGGICTSFWYPAFLEQMECFKGNLQQIAEVDQVKVLLPWL